MKPSTLKLALLSASMAAGMFAPQAFAKPITEADRVQILKTVDADAPPETGYGDEEFDSEETGDEGSYY